jgi:hypothetical protein
MLTMLCVLCANMRFLPTWVSSFCNACLCWQAAELRTCIFAAGLCREIRCDSTACSCSEIESPCGVSRAMRVQRVHKYHLPTPIHFQNYVYTKFTP